MFLFVPATLSVKISICSLTLSKSVNFLSGTSPNWPHGTRLGSCSCTNQSSKGLRVTTPDPLGKKSIPTIDSKTEDFPDDCCPQTAIRGRLIIFYKPMSLRSSYRKVRWTEEERVAYNDSNKLSKLVVEETSFFFLIFLHLIFI